jgi:hypothetical protein
MGLKPCRYLYTTREPEQCGRGKCPEIIIPVDQNECPNVHSDPRYVGYTCVRREWTDKESADPGALARPITLGHVTRDKSG